MKKKRHFNFLSYVLPALLVLCLVFSCKSSPPVSETEPESASAQEASDESVLEIPPEIDAGAAAVDNQSDVYAEAGAEAAADVEVESDAEAYLEAPDQYSDEEDNGAEVPESIQPEPDLEIPEEAPVIPEPVLPAEPPPVVQPPQIPPPVPETLSPPQMTPDQSVIQPEMVLPVPVQPSVPREPPSPPPGLRPAEPTPPVDQPVEPMPEEERPMLPPLPGRTTPEGSGENIVFSRIVRAAVGQMVEIPFRGTGWVYLGELGNRRGISYDSRRLDIIGGHVEGQSFIFRAETAGTYILKFYKQDFIQDYIINDYVQVIAGEAEVFMPGQYVDRGRVVAEPRWPSPDSSSDPIPMIQEPSNTEFDPLDFPPAELSPMEPVPELPAETFPEIEPAEYIRQARQEFDGGRIEQAFNLMDAMIQRYPMGTDEAWWLLGQLYEANTPEKDVRLALEYYRRLINEYPQSPRVPGAQQRVAYLERYYFNIR